MNNTILVLNSGSSSQKFRYFPADANLFCEGGYAGIGHCIHFSAKDNAGAPLVDEQLTVERGP